MFAIEMISQADHGIEQISYENDRHNPKLLDDPERRMRCPRMLMRRENVDIGMLQQHSDIDLLLAPVVTVEKRHTRPPENRIEHGTKPRRSALGGGYEPHVFARRRYQPRDLLIRHRKTCRLG